MSDQVREIEARGLRFRCRESGEAGEPVILLHGFPETSHMWSRVMPRLVDAGYQCLAPDQRGYSPGARPGHAAAYTYFEFATDIAELATAKGWERFHLVGHDWGAGAGWAAVSLFPRRIHSWTALSVPHMAAFGHAIRRDDDQRERSRYVQYFQSPGVAEASFAANGFALLKNLWSQSDEAEQADYLSVLSQPGALTAALNWYRGTRGIDPIDEAVTFGPVDTPTTLVWGNRDPAIGRQATVDAASYMTGSYRFIELDAGHWLVQERCDDVTAAIIRHLKEHPMA